MTRTISIDIDFLEHKSGTKFYEVMIVSCTNSGEFFEIKRWGKAPGPPGRNPHCGTVLIKRFLSLKQAAVSGSRTINGKRDRGYEGVGFENIKIEASIAEHSRLCNEKALHKDVLDLIFMEYLAGRSDSTDPSPAMAKTTTPAVDPTKNYGDDWGVWS